MNKIPLTVVSLIVFVVSLLPMPYGFYFITRIVFAIICGYLAYKLFFLGNLLWLIGLGLVILYNPLIPIHLGEKTIWIVMNILSCGFIYCSESKLKDD